MNGVGDRIKGTETMEFVNNEDIPKYKKVTPIQILYATTDLLKQSNIFGGTYDHWKR